MTSQPDGFLTMPPAGSGPGILVLHAWWGLNDTIRAFCTRLADSGFVVFAPDLYHGKIAVDIPGAEKLCGEINSRERQAKLEIAEALAFLTVQPGVEASNVAVIGFSLGAYFALELGASDAQHINKVVMFYGTGSTNHGESRAAYMGHFAENDEFEPSSSVDGLEASLKSAGLPVTIHHYAGVGHWFFEPDRTDAYNEAASSLAWERTLAFLKAEL